MTTTAPNYYADNPLNRLSYLRSSPAFLASALSDSKSRFILYNNLNPLCAPPAEDGSIKLHTVGWEDVKKHITDDPKALFANVDGKNEKALGEVSQYWFKSMVDKAEKDGVSFRLTKDEKVKHFVNQNGLVFLGVDERSAPHEAKSLPLTKPDENSSLSSHSPHGVPYWAFDVSNVAELRDQFVNVEKKYEYVDMRSGMSAIPPKEAAVGAEGRSLLDWNKRNVYCPACSRPMRSVWAGWKRACSPGEPEDAPCLSKKGVHNFNYPRTDPVVIMAVLSPDRESILLGRQRVWPKKFYSCLAGFIESGETIEEAVRREVYEEAGIEIGDVYYHSSQPWPYPSSMMIGCIGVAKENQTIRTDLDNELEDARYFTRSEVLSVINGTGRQHMSREEVARIDGKEGAVGAAAAVEEDDALFRMPPVTAIANVLVVAWANNQYFGAPTGKL